MSYSLEFDARPQKEWQKLGDTIRQQMKKKPASVLINPRIEANRLHGLLQHARPVRILCQGHGSVPMAIGAQG